MCQNQRSSFCYWFYYSYFTYWGYYFSLLFGLLLLFLGFFDSFSSNLFYLISKYVSISFEYLFLNYVQIAALFTSSKGSIQISGIVFSPITVYYPNPCFSIVILLKVELNLIEKVKRNFWSVK